MESYLGYLQTAINKLPLACVADEFLYQLGQKGLLEDPSPTKLFSLSVESIESQIKLVARVVALYFVYPQLAPISSKVNAGMGVVHLLMGGIQRLKTKDADETQWHQVAFNIHKGLAHLMIAGYDYGIGFSARNKYLVVGSMVLFAAQPLILQQFHQKFFKKQEVSSSMLDKVTTYLADDCMISDIATKIIAKFLPKPVMPPADTAPSVQPGDALE